LEGQKKRLSTFLADSESTANFDEKEEYTELIDTLRTETETLRLETESLRIEIVALQEFKAERELKDSEKTHESREIESLKEKLQTSEFRVEELTVLLKEKPESDNTRVAELEINLDHWKQKAERLANELKSIRESHPSPEAAVENGKVEQSSEDLLKWQAKAEKLLGEKKQLEKQLQAAQASVKSGGPQASCGHEQELTILKEKLERTNHLHRTAKSEADRHRQTVHKFHAYLSDSTHEVAKEKAKGAFCHFLLWLIAVLIVVLNAAMILSPMVRDRDHLLPIN